MSDKTPPKNLSTSAVKSNQWKKEFAIQHAAIAASGQSSGQSPSSTVIAFKGVYNEIMRILNEDSN